MRNKSVYFILCLTFSISACSQSLVDDIYDHARHGVGQEAGTAFVVLSNISLSQSDITRIQEDYKNESDAEKRYYYQFLLAKRTQENRYINAFIENSKEHFPLLVQNKTNWISIASPFYKQLSYYSRTNDDALVVLFKLSQIGDGSGLAIVAEDLSEIRKANPKRFSKAAKNADVREAEILKLMEDE